MTQIKESIVNYKNAIERLAKNNSELVFDNSGVDHAGIVLSTILKNSNDIVRIYATDMNGDISNQSCYQDSINQFLGKSGKLKIILDDDTKLSKTIMDICDKYSDNISVKKSSPEFQRIVTSVSKEGNLYHFAIGDDRMFRMELDQISHKAICSFNLPGTSKMLIDLFEEYFSKLPSPTRSIVQ